VASPNAPANPCKALVCKAFTAALEAPLFYILFNACVYWALIALAWVLGSILSNLS
jgi:hypothetical protein